MAGFEDPMLKLALVLALCGLIPVGSALASDRRPANQTVDGIETVRHEAKRDSRRLAAAAPVDAAGAIAAARAAGHGNITEVEWERGGWKLRSSDANGWPVRLWVDGWTGQVTIRQR